MRFSYQLATLAVSVALLAAAIPASAQAPTRFVGTITAINGNTLTVKTDADGIHQVNVPATAVLQRITPGQKDLSAAAAILLGNLEAGDRVRVKLNPGAPAGAEEALQIIAVKQSDLALKQQRDREDWQRRGVGGLVKSVDAAGGVIVLTSGEGNAAKTVTVHTTPVTILKRYAPASVRYDAALPAPISAIHAGDQLRARGNKNNDGAEIAAEEIISGSFRNISGVILSLNTAGSDLVVKDLTTKKPVTIHITADAQMRRLPEHAAQTLAALLKGNAGNGEAATPHGAGPSNGGDAEQMLSRAPAIQLGDLKKGEAVMLVSTEGASEVTAITLLAGVEPLLEASAASQNLLSNWSLGSGAPEAAQ